MNKEYRLAIEKLFFAELEQIDPQFKKVSAKSPWKYDGEAIAVKSVGTIRLFVTVFPNPKGAEEFAVEIGWSKRDEFPNRMKWPNILSADDNSVFDQDDGMIRLSAFSNRGKFGWKFKGIDSENVNKYFSGTGALETTPKEIIEQDFIRKPTKEEAIEAVKFAVEAAIVDLKTSGLLYLEKFLRQVNG